MSYHIDDMRSTIEANDFKTAVAKAANDRIKLRVPEVTRRVIRIWAT